MMKSNNSYKAVVAGYEDMAGLCVQWPAKPEMQEWVDKSTLYVMARVVFLKKDDAAAILAL